MLEVIEADFARLEVDTKVADALTRPRRAPHSSDDTIGENEIDTLNKEIDELAKTIDDPEAGLKKQIKDTEESLEATSRVDVEGFSIEQGYYKH